MVTAWNLFVKRHAGRGYTMQELASKYKQTTAQRKNRIPLRKAAPRRARALSPRRPAIKARPKVAARRPVARRARSSPRAPVPRKRVVKKKPSLTHVQHLPSDMRKKDVDANRKAAVRPVKKTNDMTASDKAKVARSIKQPCDDPKYCQLDQRQLSKILMYYGLQRKINVQDLLKRGTARADPNKICKLMPVLFPAKGVQKYAFVRFLGEGSFGQVYEVQDLDTGERCAAKLIMTNQNVSIRNEVAMQKKFHKIGVAPEVHYYTSMKLANPSPSAVRMMYKVGVQDASVRGKSLHLIFMDLVSGKLEDYLKTKRSTGQLDHLVSQLSAILSKLAAHKMTHGDLHCGNIAYTSLRTGNANMSLIDFGFSSDRTVAHIMDLIQFYRGNFSTYVKINASNREYLQNKIRELARSKYKVVLPKTDAGIESAWSNMTYAYRKKYCK